MPESYYIDGQEIKAGKNALVRLNVSRLPSDTLIDINVHVFRSRKSGPTVLLLGGMHGDEINGVEIVRRAVRSKSLRKLQKGTIIAIPLLNVYGFNHFSRAVPDGKDLNRSFPGTASGSLASRVAHTLSTKILPLIDIGLDFHTGGNTIHNSPQTRVTIDDERGIEIAKVFGAPMMLQNQTISKSMRRHAVKNGKSIVVFEGGESMRIDDRSIAVGLQGIRNVLEHLEMLPALTEEKNRTKSLVFTNSKWLRAPRAGIFSLHKLAGQEVKKGEVLGEINRLEGKKPLKVSAPFDCHLFSHVNNPVVSRGDALFHLVF